MNNELQAVFEYLERERGLDKETLIRVVEEAMLSASHKNILRNNNLRVHIDRKTYDVRVLANLQVVEEVAVVSEQIPLKEARRVKPDARLGEEIEVEVTPRDFGRIAAQTAKQAILQRIRQAEKDRVFADYKERAGDIVSGAVRRFERRDVIVEIGRAEAILPESERVPIEDYQIGEPIRAYILEVRQAAHGPDIVLSRASPDFVKRLFQLEVSEIADGTVEIRGIAREPGFRTKLAVFSRDDKVDPVGACVGLRGMRVKNIVRELSGEKIDIIRWHPDVRTFVTNALSPAKLTKVDVDEPTRTVKILVEPDQLSLAIGKRGQNARLTSKLTGWRVDIEKTAAEVTFEEKVRHAVADLAAIEGVGPEFAERLVQAGFLTKEGILAAEAADLEAVEGFTSDIAAAVQSAVEKAYEKEHGVIQQ